MDARSPSMTADSLAGRGRFGSSRRSRRQRVNSGWAQTAGLRACNAGALGEGRECGSEELSSELATASMDGDEICSEVLYGQQPA